VPISPWADLGCTNDAWTRNAASDMILQHDRLSLLAQVYALRGRFELAAETQRRAVALAPDQERAAADSLLQEYRARAEDR
jgi:hypothetical protein